MNSVGHNEQRGSPLLVQEQDLMFFLYFCSKFYWVVDSSIEFLFKKINVAFFSNKENIIYLFFNFP